MPSEACAHLGQSTSTNPHCYAAGTLSKTCTQVFVLLRERALFTKGKGQEGGEGRFTSCLCVDVCQSLVITRAFADRVMQCEASFKAQQDEIFGI